MTKVLVTGANGFVGLPLCRWLGEQGYQVVAGVRSEDKLGAVPAGGVVVGVLPMQLKCPAEDHMQQAATRLVRSAAQYPQRGFDKTPTLS